MLKRLSGFLPQTVCSDYHCRWLRKAVTIVNVRRIETLVIWQRCRLRASPPLPRCRLRASPRTPKKPGRGAGERTGLPNFLRGELQAWGESLEQTEASERYRSDDVLRALALRGLRRLHADIVAFAAHGIFHAARGFFMLRSGICHFARGILPDASWQKPDANRQCQTQNDRCQTQNSSARGAPPAVYSRRKP